MTIPKTPFTRAQALDLGITPHDWRMLRHDGLVRRMVGGVFVDAALTDTVDLRVAAVELILPGDAVVGRRTATWMRGLDVHDHRGYPATPPVDVLTRTRESRPRMGIVQSHMADDLHDDDITVMGGLQVTTPLRTTTDMSRFYREVDGLVVMDHFLHTGVLTKDQIEDTFPRWARRRGVQQLRNVHRLSDPLSASPGESSTRYRVYLMGLPRPALQIPIEDPLGRPRFYIDMGWKQWRAGIEFDGVEFHPPERAEHDQARRLWIAGRGWVLVVVRKEQVFSRSDEFERLVMEMMAKVR